ncbi:MULTISPECIES: HD-GYP domain-containing protein [unclassified Sphingomonas]|uniref:HD-GYP domain-containing protein n=1 Tax=unclassified Sphingomonas TaxID=196159 RepID=UPI00226A5CCE|nr:MULTISPECIES: HD-GYP domain-containing protein [unclassified Sphingomonas]
MRRNIRPDQVELGMYVDAFDGSWLAHPFWKAGFLVRSDAERTKLRGAGVGVIIDTAKGINVEDDQGSEPQPRLAAALPRALHAAPARRPVHQWAPAAPSRIGAVARPAFGRADKVRAIALAERSTKVVKALFEDHRLGREVPASIILPVVDEIVETLEENISAFISVTRLKDKDDETYTHSVAVCALMISLARAAGASTPEIQALGLAGLLHDIGKVMIDDAILTKKGELTDDEIREIRRHPELGHALLSTDDLPPVALDVCLHHHERIDGSGYPFGLTGDAVSQAARMAAICDVYDAMTSDRAYRKGMAPNVALAHMDTTASEFDAVVLFQFMQGIGVFPPAKLVRLRSNRLALILPTKKENRLPIARAFYSTIDTAFVSYEDVVLSDSFADDQAVSAEDPANWFVVDWAVMSQQIVNGKPISIA